eukprot:6435146-Prorocentrum_lima.AAC.1
MDVERLEHTGDRSTSKRNGSSIGQRQGEVVPEHHHEDGLPSSRQARVVVRVKGGREEDASTNREGFRTSQKDRAISHPGSKGGAGDQAAGTADEPS